MFRKNIFLIILIFVAKNTEVFAQTGFEQVLEILAQDSSMRHASWGFYALDVKTGEKFAAYNPQVFLIPASGMKTVTTASVLAILGENYRYKTDFFYDGTIKDSILQGNLIFRASGDPSFGSSQQENTPLMDSLANFFYQNFKKQGIKFQNTTFSNSQKATKKLVLDNTAFKNTIPDSWEFGDISENYGAISEGFMVNENVLELQINRTMSPTKRPVILSSYPFIPDMDTTIQNNFRSIAVEGNDVNLQNYYKNKELNGEIGAGTTTFTLKIANNDLKTTFASYFLNKIMNKNSNFYQNKEKNENVLIKPTVLVLNYDNFVNKSTKSTLINYDSAHLICTHFSPNLSKLVKRCNERSVNIYAEAFLKTIGLQQKKQGTTEAGIEALLAYWKKHGVDFDGFRMADGSGMSRHNAVTPYFMANFMRIVWLDKTIGKPFYQTLPIAGETGTLEKWFQDSPARGKIRAKTGSMSGVLSYTGFAPRPDGSTIAFCLIVNNYEGKANDMRKKLTWILGKLVE